MKVGMIFPGYGSQYVGMCKELYDSSRLVQEYFEEAANCLDSNLVKLCFASSDAELSKMNNAYPAIFLVGASITALLKQEGIEPQVVAGYNTGEYSALFAAGGISFPDGLYILSKYAGLYQELLDELKESSVVRVTGIEIAELEAICNNIRADGSALHIALYSNHNECIVSGLVPAIERLREALKTLSGVKVKDAHSEIGLHSLLMDPVVGRLSMYLEKVDFNALSIPLISGSTAELITAQEAIRTNVIAHINNPVRWTDVIKQLESCDVIIEVGPGNSLQQPIQAWYPNKQVITVNKPEDIEKVKSLVCIKQDNPVEPVDEHI
ncbi:MAG TPA: ACP S-malonyltransferase [Candidatus Dependentiae bacterium]|nr:ACP S-malonyltransferase [Candidatus Dependentiae bacterium]